MTAHRTRRIVLAMLAVVIVVGALAYTFRVRVVWTPVIGHLLRSQPSSSAGYHAAGVTDAKGEQAASHALSASTETGTPRGEVTIDPRRQQLIGVKTVPATRGSVAQTIHAVGLVRYDETRLADINLKVDGWIRDLYVDFTGQPVSTGQPLFTIYSPEMLTTENEYLLALKTQEQLQQSQIADARTRAEQLVGAARERLRLWDLSDEQITALEQTREAQPTVTFRSPFTGVVVDKQAVKGMHVMPGQTLYELADLSVVWLEADVYENDIRQVRLGAKGTVTLNAYPNERFTGRAIYIGSSMDEKTRTVKVRFSLVNRANRLKPGMYANVELTEAGATGLLVPTNAVLDSGREQLVFVAQGDGHFEPRRVKTGRRLHDAVEIVEGLKEGEKVANGATFFLDSESQLRASLQGYEPSQAGAASTASAMQLDITFRSVPDPPKAGENQLEVVVKDPVGKPIDDAQVDVQFLMAAMPTMNMPAMRNSVTLSPAGGGTYRGTGQVMMAGRWETTVIVMRGGQRLGTKQLPVIAR
jgi:membrane fusion protein, copper/silver efflux system